jgi:hypothetical protein
MTQAFQVIHGLDIEGFHKIEVVNDSWRKVTVYKQGDYAMIGFHETFGNWWDWALNLLAEKVPYHGRKVHLGFLAEYLTFAGDLIRTMDGVKTYDAYAFSQGGAHATLFHMDHQVHGIMSRTTTTFGSPRCVTKAPATAGLIHCRFTNDPIWRLPARPFGWADTGSIVYRKFSDKWIDIASHSVEAYDKFFDFPEVK